MDVLVMGEPMAEFVANAEATQYRYGVGGDASNFAVAASRQGIKAGIATALGKDAFGNAILDFWHERQVDTRYVKRDASRPTAVYFVTPLVSGHAFTYYRSGSAASAFAAADLPDSAFTGLKFLHVTAITQAISTASCDAVFDAISRAQAAGVQVSYDTNLRLKLWELPRARAIIHETVRLADLCLPSLDDVRVLTGLEEPEAIVDYYLKLGARQVVLKLGAEGCIAATPEQRWHVPGHRVQSVDGTGAGDAFGGSLIAALVHGDTLSEAARYANIAAALSTLGYGATSAIPERAEVMALLGR